MNKKVLSAILFSALFAGTGTFTSCIDTDEPAGIEELRGAKAELLRAKVSVEQAQASLLLAQAEVEKAKAAKQLADAEISEALAAIAQAKADSINVSNDADRETLKMTIAQNQMKLEALQAKHQTIMNNLNSALAQSQRSYEIMLAQIEIAKAVGSSENFVTISELQRKVRRAQSKVNAAQADVKDAQKKYDFAVAYDETHAELNAKTLEAWVAAAEDSLVEAQAVLAKWEGYLASAENADWAKEIKALDDSLAAIKKDTVELNLAIEKAKASDSLVALGDALEAANNALAEAEAALETEEDLTYTYKYLVGKQDYEGKVPAGTKLDAAVEMLAGKGKTIDQLKNAIASYTTEKQYWLDSLAVMVNDSIKEDSVAKAKVLKGYKDALAAYKAAKPLSKDAITKATTGAYAVYTDALTKANGDATKIVVAKQNFADAIVAFYNSLPAAQVTLNTITLKTGTNAAGTATYATKTAKDWLTGNEKAIYFDGLVAYFGDDVTKLWTKGTKETVANNVVNPAATGAIATWVEKVVEGDQFTENADGTYTAKSLLGSLQLASTKAFGEAMNYHKLAGVTEEMQNGYLHNEPTLEDIKYVFNNVSQEVGEYGLYLLADDDDTAFEAMNYKAIIADYEAAIEFWTAAVEGYEAAIEAQEEAVEAATAVAEAAKEAYDSYEETVITPMEEKIAALNAKAGRIAAIQDALREALAAYLPDEFTKVAGSGYVANAEHKTNLEAFVTFLNEEIAAAKDEVVAKEYALANAQMWATLIENGEGIVEKAQAELDEAIANLEAKQAKLDEALANLAKGLEIIAAVNAAE